MRVDRIVNVRFQLDGLHFDAAIDPDWRMHAYPKMSLEEKEAETPIEVYCFEHPEWDVLMIYQDESNEQQESYTDYFSSYVPLAHTCCNFDKIIEDTKKWIEDMSD